MDIITTRRSKVEKGYELLADITVELAPVTNVDISGLNIGKGDELVLVSDIISASIGDCRITINGNNTLTNYYSQYLYVNGTDKTSGRQNNPSFAGVGFTTSRTMQNVNIKLTNSGYFLYQSCESRDYGGLAIKIVPQYGTSTFTVPSITLISIVSGVSNNIGIGSRFQLYKIGGA